MAKIRLIGNYKKRSTPKDVNGLPVLDPITNQPTSKLVTMWRYGVVEATKEELDLYKKFKNQDGEYYREEGGIPIYVTQDYQGKESKIRSYVNDEGRIGFVLDTTELDELSAMAEKFPSLRESIQLQQMAIMQSGKRLEIKALVAGDEGGEGEPEGKTTKEVEINAGAGDDGGEGGDGTDIE